MSKKPDDVEICVQSKDNGKGGDGKYCAIVMGWNEASKKWYNTGIVIRDSLPILAFNRALVEAIEKGWWK
jgi:hypothetical protein